MTVSTQLELLDLRHFSAGQLRPLLDDEARVWKRRLRWNYESSVELLLQYLDSRVLPGFVALERGRVCGYTFFVYEGPKAVVGDVYAIAGEPAQAMLITERLIARLLDLLEHSPDVERVESQMLLYDSGALANSFVGAGFLVYPRLFMEYDPSPNLRNGGRTPARFAAATIPEYLELNEWTGGCYQPAAELIHAAYAGHIDSSINDQYRTLHGSLRFLHNIVRFPGCGVFAPKSSWVVRDARTDTLAGMLLCSRVSSDVAHITQLCVAGPYRRHGLGRFLMEHCMAKLADSGFSAITLTVTEANEAAVKLYESFGFTLRHRFDAMVKDMRSTQRDSWGLRG